MSIPSHIAGRWDLTVHHPDGDFPSWIELLADGNGQFVGQFGNARPIQFLSFEDEILVFALPKQYEQRDDDLRFEGSLEGQDLRGVTTHGDGTAMRWTGIRAPLLPNREVEWSEPINLIQDPMDNWEPRSPNWVSNWAVVDGQLTNSGVGSDLMLRAAQDDFRLIAEYKYPSGSNSGIYLRGRYEVQIVDDYGKEPSWGSSGAIYGFLIPSTHAIKEAEEWNRLEIELIGRWVTIILNDQKIIDNAEIPGITGGALDSNEGDPGSMFLQGDHGPITFRKLELSESR